MELLHPFPEHNIVRENHFARYKTHNSDYRYADSSSCHVCRHSNQYRQAEGQEDSHGSIPLWKGSI